MHKFVCNNVDRRNVFRNIILTFVTKGKQQVKHQAAPIAKLIKNESIESNNIRLIQKDETTGKTSWQIFNKDEALKLAR